MKASPYFTPIQLSKKSEKSVMENYWGIPFATSDDIDDISLDFKPFAANYLIFAHASDIHDSDISDKKQAKPFRGNSPLGAKVCDYIINYADGSKEVVPIRCRYEINNLHTYWGEGAFLAVPHERFRAIPTVTDDIISGKTPNMPWGPSQPRVTVNYAPETYWLFAWENPHPERAIAGMEIQMEADKLHLKGITAGHIKEHPLRYSRRQKTILPHSKIDIDLGQIISVLPRPLYDNNRWEEGYNNQQPAESAGEYIIELAAHEQAIMFLGDEGIPLPIRDLPAVERLSVPPSEQPVTLKVIGPEGKPAAVKVHAHGIGGEYLPPRHRHRIPNPYWFEDYSVDFVHGPHWCTYIDGSAEYLLPQGEVFFEVSKGFEIKPVRKRFVITPDTKEIEINLESVLDWRSRGWVTADTHVHFLSPNSALLEGEAEGVNIVNLLASQWGELFTNIGDFDGKTTLSTDDSEYMVRVGTENRQRILGHISLLGYEGNMILPLTTGGPDESALGDPVETTLTQWAAKSREQFGLNILPHFPNPRAEGAAAIVSDLIDGVEMTSWGDLYSGISPYSLSDWYRYLNCGYHIAAVGGTDKMSADTAVGTVRTYALIEGPMTYASWKDAVKAGRTFATYGALADLRVEGKRPGERINLQGPATLQIDWSVASATIPITAVELVVGGETKEVKRLDPFLGSSDGSFNIKIDGSTWAAIRVRGHHKDKPEIITAHTSAVMAIVDGKRPMDAPDAVTILEQIEGATAYIKTIGTKAQERQFKKALDALTSAHRALHNRLHEMGHYHKHTVLDDHHKN